MVERKAQPSACDEQRKRHKGNRATCQELRPFSWRGQQGTSAPRTQPTFICMHPPLLPQPFSTLLFITWSNLVVISWGMLGSSQPIQLFFINEKLTLPRGCVINAKILPPSLLLLPSAACKHLIFRTWDHKQLLFMLNARTATIHIEQVNSKHQMGIHPSSGPVDAYDLLFFVRHQPKGSTRMFRVERKMRKEATRRWFSKCSRVVLNWYSNRPKRRSKANFGRYIDGLRAYFLHSPMWRNYLQALGEWR